MLKSAAQPPAFVESGTVFFMTGATARELAVNAERAARLNPKAPQNRFGGPGARQHDKLVARLVASSR